MRLIARSDLWMVDRTMGGSEGRASNEGWFEVTSAARDGASRTL